ncbi:MAG: glucosamine-6-phosphate deaminase [Lentisphaeria bacterium]
MEIIIQNDPEKSSCIAARYLAKIIREKPNAVLGLATGSTPVKLYNELIRMHREEGLDFSRITTFNLDEYVGLPPEHPASYKHFMHENLFKHINIPEANIHIPDGLTPDIPEHCRQYEGKIEKAGGLDAQVLGIGSDGHIGFNEPISSLASRTRIKTLTEETIADNARFFDSSAEVPRHVLTMGIGTILDSRTCLMLAFGQNKAKALAQAVEGPIAAAIPASALQLHPAVKVFCDDNAATDLKRAEYYRWVYSNKPEWQQFV